MQPITRNLIFCAALLATCLLPLAAHAKGDKPDKREPRKSGIIGQVEQIPGPWQIRIDSKKDKFIEDIQADDDGYFMVDLKPGTYILTPFYSSIDGTAELVGVSSTVTVEKKEFTTVELFIVVIDFPVVYESGLPVVDELELSGVEELGLPGVYESN